MLERNEISSPVDNCFQKGIDPKQAIVEDLVLKLGVPVAGVGTFVEALYAAFGKDDHPDQRIKDYLLFKLGYE